MKILIYSKNRSLLSELFLSSFRYRLEVRPKLRWATNTDTKVQLDRGIKRSLQYDDDNDNLEQIENTPLSKRQSTLMDDDNEIIKPKQQSVIDDDELDFL